ncbi:hypothetical protein Bca52824_005692 [Brassica carinata]|uniref:Oleosin n=1 Tax=Brassica carinata TaxID=52824 RepID=A0A8X8BHQ7_BRACI|nr:hypothetical protein Bca52824_005692 [Brassica carinata]
MVSFLLPVLEVIKVVMASVASVVFLGFAGVTLACSAVALAVSTPVFIIFSPILVPATIATTLIATGLGTGTTLGMTGIGLLMRLIKNPEGASPTGSSPGKEGAHSAPAAQPSFLSLLGMPNLMKSRMIERLIDIPGIGRGKSKEFKEEGDVDCCSSKKSSFDLNMIPSQKGQGGDRLRKKGL